MKVRIDQDSCAGEGEGIAIETSRPDSGVNSRRMIETDCSGHPSETVAAVYTVGHGTLSEDAFVELVTGAGVEQVVDVRSFPGSRHNPQHGKDQISSWLPPAGVRYSWSPVLGGRRRPREGSSHFGLRHPSFRAYADHMETDEFRRGIAELLALGPGVAVMCSEAVWWRCHRRLLADYVLLVHGIEVIHLMPNGRRNRHRPTDRVRLEGDGLVYGGPAPQS